MASLSVRKQSSRKLVENAHNALGIEKDEQHEKDTHNQLPSVGYSTEILNRADVEKGPHNGAHEAGIASDHGHDHHVKRHEHVDEVGRHHLLEQDEEGSRQSCNQPRKGKQQKLREIDVYAQKMDTIRVRFVSGERIPQRGPQEIPADHDDEDSDQKD